LIVAVELASAGSAVGAAAAAPGLTTVVTVSVDGATGTWVTDQSTAAAPVATEATATSTAPVEESISPSEPQPATRS
jgi:hypothetical protein